MLSRQFKVYILILIIIIFITSITVFYLQIINPLQNKIKISSTQLAREQSIVINPSKTTDVPDEQFIIETKSLQSRVPVSPSIESFLLDLNKAEVASDCKITSIVFGDGNEIDNKQTGINSSLNSTNQDNIINGSNEGTSNISQNSSQLNESLPKGIKKKSMSVMIETENYIQFNNFIEEIESLQRIASIDSIEFESNESDTTASDQTVQPLSFQLSISIFYYPTLETLLKSTKPKIVTPNPSNKTNPLESTTSLTEKMELNTKQTSLPAVENSASEENQPISNSTEKPRNVLTHKVLPGETLFSIAMKYYHSRDGETLIEMYNHLNGITIYSGMTLSIPIY